MTLFDRDKWQEIMHTLRQNRLRTALTAFGVSWGIFILIVMLGAGNGLQNAVFAEMGDFSTNSMFIWAQGTTIPYKGFPRNRWYHFDVEDMEALKRAIPEIEIITPTVHGGGFRTNSNLVYKDQRGSFRVQGVMPTENLVDPVEIAYGRFLNEFDELNKRKVVLLGWRVYEELFSKDEDPINKYVKLNGMFFQVIGVYKSKHSGGWGDHQNSNVFIPFSTTSQIYNYPNKVDHFSIVGNANSNINKIEDEVKVLLASRHDIHPDDDAAFGYNNVGEQFKKINGLFLGIRGLVWFVGICTLLAGVIGVSNIMLIIIKERTQEFGIKRAMGATPMKIISSVISESVFLTSLAGLTGMAMGIYVVNLVDKIVGTPEDMRNVAFLHPSVDFNVALTAVVILIIFGALAGIIPARRAVSIKPIEAIRAEI